MLRRHYFQLAVGLFVLAACNEAADDTDDTSDTSGEPDAVAMTDVSDVSDTVEPDAAPADLGVDAPPSEECDDGADNDGDGAVDCADDDCRGTVACAVCGDGAVEGDEECDEGDQNSDTRADACRTDCRSAACGDGVLDRGEACDGSITCTGTCEVIASCGDGEVQAPEECDVGSVTAEGCVQCIAVGPVVCGDGVRVAAVEACEYDTHCPPSHGCTGCECEYIASCGNGIVDEGEACEVDADCADAGEWCNGCRCRDTVCGNGDIEGREECDPRSLEPNSGCAFGVSDCHACRCVFDDEPPRFLHDGPLRATYRHAFECEDGSHKVWLEVLVVSYHDVANLQIRREGEVLVESSGWTRNDSGTQSWRGTLCSASFLESGVEYDLVAIDTEGREGVIPYVFPQEPLDLVARNSFAVNDGAHYRIVASTTGSDAEWIEVQARDADGATVGEPVRESTRITEGPCAAAIHIDRAGHPSWCSLRVPYVGYESAASFDVQFVAFGGREGPALSLSID